MRTIQKKTEPPSLTVHRHQSHSDYDNYTDNPLCQCERDTDPLIV